MALLGRAQPPARLALLLLLLVLLLLLLHASWRPALPERRVPVWWLGKCHSAAFLLRWVLSLRRR